MNIIRITFLQHQKYKLVFWQQNSSFSTTKKQEKKIQEFSNSTSVAHLNAQGFMSTFNNEFSVIRTNINSMKLLWQKHGWQKIPAKGAEIDLKENLVYKVNLRFYSKLLPSRNTICRNTRPNWKHTNTSIHGLSTWLNRSIQSRMVWEIRSITLHYISIVERRFNFNR